MNNTEKFKIEVFLSFVLEIKDEKIHSRFAETP